MKIFHTSQEFDKLCDLWLDGGAPIIDAEFDTLDIDQTSLHERWVKRFRGRIGSIARTGVDYERKY